MTASVARSGLALALGGALAISAACDRRERSPAPPTGSAAGLELPDPLTLDWRNLRYELASLGVVQARDGRADFRVIDDEDGLRVTQDPSVTRAWAGYLVLAPPTYADLDGDGLEEAAIPFELKSAQLDDSPHVFGVFVYTLRGGEPVSLGAITTTSKGGFAIANRTITTTEGAAWIVDPDRRELVRRH